MLAFALQLPKDMFYLWNTGLESTFASPPPPKKSPKNEQNKNSLERVGSFPFKTIL